MKIYNTRQVKEWDAYTIANEPIASIDLMERAAGKCIQWILSQNWQTRHFLIFCGKGNNGGDGLAVARLLTENGLNADVYILEFGRLGTDDFQTNLQRLHGLPVEIYFVQSDTMFPKIEAGNIVIDALFGSGLNKPLEGLTAELVKYINKTGATVISIDVPSGLYIDRSSAGNVIIKADITLTFQTQKLAFLLAENAAFIGNVQVLDIGLHPGFEEKATYQLLESSFIKKKYQPRNEFSHKGTFGHALLIGGSYGKIGALVLSTKACLRTGAGLVTAYIPKCGYNIIQTAIPEAMVITDVTHDFISQLPSDLEKYTSIGIGPGLGTEENTRTTLISFIANTTKPVVIDADGLNCLAIEKESLYHLPPHCILTPHPKEFERLFGKTANDFERIELAQKRAHELNAVIILKGHHTFIATPEGPCYFNNTGNAGMATGGTGDVLTGMLVSLLGQGYTPVNASLLGVYLHGLAGDMAAEDNSMEALIAGDLVQYIGAAFRRIL